MSFNNIEDALEDIKDALGGDLGDEDFAGFLNLTGVFSFSSFFPDILLY